MMRVARERAGAFRELPGLVQKYYFHHEGTGEIGGVYIWETAEAFAAYRESDLRKSITSSYKLEGEPTIKVLKILMPLREEA